MKPAIEQVCEERDHWRGCYQIAAEERAAERAKVAEAVRLIDRWLTEDGDDVNTDLEEFADANRADELRTPLVDPASA
jgi:hypothetical protein